MAEKGSESERLTALIEKKLADLEARAEEGESLSLAELNGVRRLVNWVESERQLAQARELTRGYG
jgi:hypothetical protein